MHKENKLDRTTLKNLVSNTRILKGLKFLEESKSSDVKISGWTAVHGKRVNLSIAFSPDFPNSKPKVCLDNSEEFDLLPHVSSDGTTCFLDDEGIMLDESNPQGILSESLKFAVKTLKSSIAGENKLDFFQEFDAYFEYFEGYFLFNSIYAPSSNIQKITSVIINNEVWIGKRVDQLERHIEKFNSSNAIEKYKDFLFIPLTKGSIKHIDLPKKKSFWSISAIRKMIFKNLDGKRIELRKRLAKDKSISVIVSLPLENDSEILFGFIFRGSHKAKHPLIDTNVNKSVIPIKINRVDKKYVLPRGGSNTELSDKKVAVIGCGSVGSVIAVELAKVGITDLLLIDNDSLNEDNFYRHVLGQISGVGIKKVDGLKKEIEGKLPLTNIEIFPKKFQDAIGEIDFSKIDLVVNATGVPNTNIAINRYFIDNYRNLPVVNVWVEPLGIGGHVLVTNNGNKNGCYKCLLTRDSDIGLYNTYSFAAPNQSFRKSIAGCASRFTPFSSLDSTQSAIEAVRASIDILKGDEVDNPLISWKGRNKNFREQGYETSNRYNLTNEQLFLQRYDYKQNDCDICGKILKD